MLARLRLLAIVACVATAPVAFADAVPTKHALPRLEGHIVDPAGALSARAREGIDAELTRFRRETTYSLVVYITPSLDGASIEDAAYEAFNTWKIGDAGKDTGILLLLARVERRIRIETGKGAGGAVTDLQANAIIGEMGQLMARGDTEMAVTVGIRELEAAVRKEVGPATSRPRTTARSSDMSWLSAVTIIVIVLVVVLVLVLGQRRRTHRRGKQGLFDDGAQKAKAAGAVLEVLGGVLRIIGAVASAASKSTGGGSKRRSGGGGGRSGGGGSSGSY